MFRSTRLVLASTLAVALGTPVEGRPTDAVVASGSSGSFGGAPH